ncbi:MAG TPA: hypothetical protein PK577_05825 [Candidatus Syntrophosphaera thermopropionivorans]|nr:hypothetical protein [Candidatus Syntrophosphaera thermopropionivorans]
MSYDLYVDLRAIQRYIFSSNKLRDNLGASYLVSHIFDDFKDENTGFCGGGNLYRQCDNEIRAKEIVRDLSRAIFETAPGLSFNAAIVKTKENEDFSSRIKRLHQKLEEEKQNHQQITTLRSYGVNAQCSSGPLSAQYRDPFEKDKYISEVVYTKRIKLLKNDKENDKEDDTISDEYSQYLSDDFKLTEEFLEISPLKGEDSHIAVVHIDGNGIGAIFSTLKTLSDYQEFSKKLNNDMQQALRETIKILEDKIRKGEWDYNYKTVNEENVLKYILPLRPIYIGGDDITFVCEGKLGIVLACTYIEQIKKILNDKEITFCAGIAIAKTNFPFFQTYKAAEALCRSAKNKRMKEDEIESYIDFHMINSSIYSNLEEVRKIQYKSIDGINLLYRPYKIDDLKTQIENAINFAKAWPNSKLAKFREVLYKESSERRTFSRELKTRGDLELYCKGESFQDFQTSEDFTLGSKTIFLDIIELIDLLPEEKANEIPS